jgi:hypothetical protein
MTRGKRTAAEFSLGSTDTRAPAGLAPIAVGLGLTLIHLVGIPLTNLSVNPARSTGPALFAGGWAIHQLWAFWRASLIAARWAEWSRRPYSENGLSGEPGGGRWRRQGRQPLGDPGHETSRRSLLEGRGIAILHHVHFGPALFKVHFVHKRFHH